MSQHWHTLLSVTHIRIHIWYRTPEHTGKNTHPHIFIQIHRVKNLADLKKLTSWSEKNHLVLPQACNRPEDHWNLDTLHITDIQTQTDFLLSKQKWVHVEQLNECRIHHSGDLRFNMCSQSTLKSHENTSSCFLLWQNRHDQKHFAFSDLCYNLHWEGKETEHGG